MDIHMEHLEKLFTENGQTLHPESLIKTLYTVDDFKKGWGVIDTLRHSPDNRLWIWPAVGVPRGDLVVCDLGDFRIVHHINGLYLRFLQYLDYVHANPFCRLIDLCSAGFSGAEAYYFMTIALKMGKVGYVYPHRDEGCDRFYVRSF